MKEATDRVLHKGISLTHFIEVYSTERRAEQWSIRNRWPNGICCRRYKSVNVQTGSRRPTMPFRCREQVCGSPRSGTNTAPVMEGSRRSYQNWIIAMFRLGTDLKSFVIMRPHCDLDIPQKSPWFLAHRPRDAQLQNGTLWFDGPVAVEYAYMGGCRREMGDFRREAMARLGRGAAGETTVVGAKVREANQVAATVIAPSDLCADDGVALGDRA